MKGTRRTVSGLLGLAWWGALVPVLAAEEFTSPIGCELGKTCFIQQLPDMDPGPAAVDPFCGRATYQGHDGTDFRVLSMADMEVGVPVLAIAEGVVARARDGMPDQLVRSEGERRLAEGRECGNGLVVRHGGVLEAQYCHLKRGSIRVKPGDGVTAGQLLAEVGASGLAQFPHLHLTLRRDGKALDPWTGAEVGSGCAVADRGTGSLFAEELLQAAREVHGQILHLGLAGRPVTHEELSRTGPPRTAAPGDRAVVGWIWLANLAAGDRVSLHLSREGSGVLASETWRIDRSLASQLYFVGRRMPVEPGSYVLAAELSGPSRRSGRRMQFVLGR